MERRKKQGRKIMLRLQEPTIAALDQRAAEKGTDRGIEVEAAVRRDLQREGR
jgi:hypothetical protein